MRNHKRLARLLYNLDTFEPRWMLAASKVVFTTAPVSIAAGVPSPVIIIQLQDAGGVAATAGAGGQLVNLSTSSSSGTFFDGANQPITSVVVPAGDSTATFTYGDDVAASPVLTVSAPGLAPTMQAETVAATAPTQLAITTLPAGSLANTSSTNITVVLRDAKGNVAVAPTGGTVISLSSTSAGGTFSATASMTIAAGTSSATFTYKDTIVGTPTITVSSSGLTPVAQQQTIYSATTVATKPDPAGLGSYASTPPGGQNAPTAYGTSYDWINRPSDSPLPTNDWWTLILKSGFAGSLYSMPQKLFTAANGVTVSGFAGINSVANNIGYSGEQTLVVGGENTSFTRDAMVSYGDWNVRFRMERAANQYVDVTAVQGSPMAWYEYTNISPKLTLGTAGTYGNISDGSGASLGNGSVGFTTDHFRFTKAGVTFGVFAPAGTVFTPSTNGLSVAFTGSAHYLVVATLPDTSNATFENFFQHAYSVPRNTTYGFSYSAAAGALQTTWDIDTEALKVGASTDILQGWLPTNYRDIVSGPAILSGNTYPTIYGPIKTSLGHSFTIVQPTNGLNFALPAPQQVGGTADFDPAKMAGWLSTYQLGGGADSYGGQTTLSQAAQLTLMAQQLGDANYTRLLNILRGAVTNWLTWQPGDTKFYTYYPKDKALIAYPPAFGSEHYTDLHFHLGYLTSSAGVLAMLDPTWAQNYGAMATMVARSYANWDRVDNSEPFLRTFNPWKAHSYADGLGDSLGNQGNNQESVSEAVQSWQGLVLLGQALGNQAMSDAGMMGYVLESKAETEYWLNVAHQDLNPPGYPVNRNTAINADFTRQQQTFFGNQPKYQLGIVGLPNWPSMDFLGKYNAAMQSTIDATMAAIGGADPYQTLGNSDDGNNWLGTILGIQGQVNPQKAAVQFARLATLNTGDNADPVSGIHYYITHAGRTYGLRDWGLHLSVPVGGVYTNTTTGKKTYVAYNSTQTTQLVQVLNAAGVVVDSFNAAPRTVTVFSPFATVNASGVLEINGTPNADALSIAQVGATITAALGTSSQSFAAGTITAVIINGLASNDTLDFSGTFAVPVTFNGGSGNDTLNVNAGTFTLNADANVGTDQLTVNVAAGASIVFNTTQHLAALNVTGNASLAAGSRRAIVTKTFSVAGGGQLDIADNDLIVDYTGSSPIAAIRAALVTGYTSGAWSGSGIRSSVAAATPGRSIGYGEASELSPAALALFGGQPIDGTSVVVGFTAGGDANLDRAVDFQDLVLLAQNYNLLGRSWSQGDFTYSGDGAVDFADLVILAQQYGTTVTRPAPLLATKGLIKARKPTVTDLV
jgi:endoglucanase Acf2